MPLFENLLSCLIVFREETEMPKVWAQICLQRMVDLAKESTTLRRILDPMFSYFNSRRQWTPPNGLAMIVLSDATYMMETSGIYFISLSRVPLEHSFFLSIHVCSVLKIGLGARQIGYNRNNFLKILFL